MKTYDQTIKNKAMKKELTVKVSADFIHLVREVTDYLKLDEKAEEEKEHWKWKGEPALHIYSKLRELQEFIYNEKELNFIDHQTAEPQTQTGRRKFLAIKTNFIDRIKRNPPIIYEYLVKVRETDTPEKFLKAIKKCYYFPNDKSMKDFVQFTNNDLKQFTDTELTNAGFNIKKIRAENQPKV